MAFTSNNLPDHDCDDILAWVIYCGGNAGAFQSEFGGQPLYIPRSLATDHRIAQTIGFDAASRLCQMVGGDTFTVPMPTAQERRRAVLILSMARLRLNQISAAIGLHSRSIMRIRSQLRDEGLLPRASRPGDIYTDGRN